MTQINPENGKPVRRSTGFFGRNTIFAPDGSPYMTRYWIGRLRLHIFHRGDLDEDCHDHPWDFWTFPFTPYVEEVDTSIVEMNGLPYRHRQVVRAWRWTFRPATHCHRVLGRYSGNTFDPRVPEIFVPCSAAEFEDMRAVHGSRIEPYYDVADPSGGPPRKIVTLVWRSAEYRPWGFLKHRDGRWCWQHWREYVLGGGKDAPCQ